jgi:peptide/nickel transport system substrate-binding protein
MSSFFQPSRRGFLGLSAAAFGSSLIGLTPRAFAATGTPKQGGTLTLLVAAEPPVLTAIATTAFNTVLVSAKVTEGLLTYDFDLNLKPQLATEWSVSPDGLEYTFKLRQGVKWHDGKDFTADDVAYSITTIKQVHPRGRNTFGNLTDIRTPDPHTVTLVLSKPAPYLISALAAAETPIVPKHLYDGTKADQNPVNSAPIGTGPFVFKEWQRGSAVLYERNPNYWDAPKPYVDKLVVRFITDPAARTIAIENGEVQLAPSTPVPYNELDRLGKLPNIAFEKRGYLYSNGVSLVAFNLDKPFFKDLRVRQAFAHVIDRNVIHKVINYGFGSPIVGPINPSLSKWSDPDLKPYPIDIATAEKLLDDAGFPRGDGGIRQKLNLDFVPSGDTYVRGSAYIKQALSKVGIDVTIRTQDFATYTKRIYTDRDYDFAFEGFSNLFDPTVGVQRLYWSKNFKPGVPFSNGSNYSNPKVDALLEASAVEVDPAKRVEQWKKIQEILVADLPDINIVSAPELTIYDKKLVDHTVGGDGVMGNLADAYFQS